ncbi:MAG: GAF domain-containing protein [Bacteroidota bacterium]|nr:GAF domain-containing protein [Bacteroidota bacterium]
MQTVNNTPRVLYVDDEENNLFVFKSAFRRYYDVLTALSGAEALQLLEENQVDVVISDQRMPVLSGVEFLRKIPDAPENVRMIMTGYSDIEAVIDALNLGKIDKYIKKPWQKEDLKRIIDEACQSLYLKRSEKEEQVHHSENIPHAVKSGNIAFQSSDESAEIRFLKEENVRLKEQVNEAYQNVQLLSEIGQEITSTLDIETILNTVYENVNQLMDASVFGIGTYNTEMETIDYRLAIEKGKRYQPYSRTMEDKNQFPVWCIENKEEVFINNVGIEYSKYIKDFNEISSTLEDGTYSEIAESYIYMPLMIKDRVIGLISVQSFNKNAFTPYHLSALRNIAIFVATALENYKAFHLIEKQKTEIEQKNVELEDKVEKRTQELRLQKDELEGTFRKLKLLTEIGQDITSTLNLDKILNTVYENVNQLMDASIFGIGIYSPEESTINYQLAIENGKRFQPYSRTMEDKNQLPVWCIENKKEIFINDVSVEFSKYIKDFDQRVSTLEDGSQSLVPLSLIYIPLLFNNNPIGVITVQGFRKFAYNQYHLDILRSLASYITTAIQNAHSYSKMTEAFEQLKAAQSKLVEAEKMASLGVLTAGVAHEINNPVNFISGGIESLKDNYEDLKKLLEQIESPKPNTPPAELWEGINTTQKQIDLKSLLVEMDILISTIQNGAMRTSEIVKGLRNFSRLDESDMKKASLEAGIDSTLVILNNKIKGRIEVHKSYANIPEIMCYPGQLNQVFLNILSNAADAIDGTGEINIKTWQKEQTVYISFSDSGSGMPEHVRAHIFEPFFTTKAVGKGTGLGLSISYGIIENHKGTIEVKSEMGKGTVFTISLPVQI